MILSSLLLLCRTFRLQCELLLVQNASTAECAVQCAQFPITKIRARVRLVHDLFEMERSVCTNCESQRAHDLLDSTLETNEDDDQMRYSNVMYDSLDRSGNCFR